MPELRKREIAYKLRIGNILKGNPIIEQVQRDISEGGVRERFNFLELPGEDKQVKRVNVIANVIDKFVSEGERKFASITLDDASGQIRVKVFGEDIKLFDNLNQGDTLLVIGMLRSFNQELYILPEIIKKMDPHYLLVRKLETEKSQPNQETPSVTTTSTATEKPIKDKIIEIIKAGEAEGGIDTEQIILKLKDATPDTINSEITKLLEDGVIYEPRPGRVRYLG